MPLNDILIARIEAVRGVQTGVNLRTYQVTAVVAPEPTFAQIATVLDAQFAPLYKPLLAPAATYRGVAVRRIFPLPSLMEGISAANVGPGTSVGEPLPLQTSGIITLRTLFAGRAFRGRVYIPFPSEGSNNVDGEPILGYVAALQLLANSFLAPVTVAAGGGSLSLTPGIFHRKHVPPRPLDNTITPMSSVIAQPKWAVQRRRGSYGRPNPPSI